MNLSNFLAAGTALLALAAQTGQGQPEKPKAVLEVVTKSVVKSQPFQAEVKVTFPDGWHGYQNPPGKDYQIPVSLEAADKVFKVTKVSYPKGTMEDVAGESSMVYSGEVKFPVTLKAGPKAGRQTLTLKVRYQLCDSSSCMPPSSVDVSARVNVLNSVPKP